MAAEVEITAPVLLGHVAEGQLGHQARARMNLYVDYEAERTLARIIGALRSARQDAGITQNALTYHLPIRGRAISEWETGAVEPKLNHLVLVADELQHRLVLVGSDGRMVLGPIRQRPGEEWVVFQRRRLATPLRNRRLARGWNQTNLGLLVGVGRDSIQRWELARVPPRAIALVVWAQKLGYTLALAPRT